MGGGGGERTNEIRGENDKRMFKSNGYSRQIYVNRCYFILFYFGRLFLLSAVLSPPKSMTLIVIQRLPISFLF